MGYHFKINLKMILKIKVSPYTTEAVELLAKKLKWKEVSRGVCQGFVGLGGCKNDKFIIEYDIPSDDSDFSASVEFEIIKSDYSIEYKEL